jgi:uncharacterized protein (DUF1330 family)
MDYVKPNVDILAPYGAKFIVRGGNVELLQSEDGSSLPDRIVFVEFPSFERCKDWYFSEPYQRNKATRLGASTHGSIHAIEGIGKRTETTDKSDLIPPSFVIVKSTVGGKSCSEPILGCTTVLEKYGGSILFDTNTRPGGHVETFEGQKLVSTVGLRFGSWDMAKSWYSDAGQLKGDVLLLEGSML